MVGLRGLNALQKRRILSEGRYGSGITLLRLRVTHTPQERLDELRSNTFCRQSALFHGLLAGHRSFRIPIDQAQI